MINRKKSLKVLMYGNPGAGKTSILTHLLAEKNLRELSLKNNILLEIEGQGAKDFIKSAESVMANFFEPEIPIPNSNNTKTRDVFSKFAINTYPTEEIYDISLSVKSFNGKKTLQKIDFSDCPGDLFIDASLRVDKQAKKKLAGIAGMVKEADVIVYAVDSVDLMENDGIPYGSSLVLLDSLTQCYKQNPNMEKMIIFVPTKFEKYYKLNKDTLQYKLDNGSEYKKFMSRFYASNSQLLDWLKNPIRSAGLEVSVLPILTLGNIEFSSFSSDSQSIGENECGSQNDKSNLPLYQYSEIIADENNKYSGYDVPKYAPTFRDYPMNFILAYLFDKVLSSKCRRYSKIKFNDKMLTSLKNNIISTLYHAPQDYAHTVIQSKLFSTAKKINKADSPSDDTI